MIRKFGSTHKWLAQARLRPFDDAVARTQSERRRGWWQAVLILSRRLDSAKNAQIKAL